jgi:hypothetical protein
MFSAALGDTFGENFFVFSLLVGVSSLLIRWAGRPDLFAEFCSLLSMSILTSSTCISWSLFFGMLSLALVAGELYILLMPGGSFVDFLANSRGILELPLRENEDFSD